MSFVDVLFALVVARVLEPFANTDELTGPGVAHLIVAGVLTLTSWIEYHNSLNRPRYFIRFPNLPLFQFLLDIGMVVVYWLVASSGESELAGPSSVPSARPEAIGVLVAFVLYALWDLVALEIRRNVAYIKRPESEDVPSRRRVTWVCLGAAAVLAAVAFLTDDGPAMAYSLDVALVVLLIGFRFAKEYWTPEDSGLTRREREFQRAGPAADKDSDSASEDDGATESSRPSGAP